MLQMSLIQAGPKKALALLEKVRVIDMAAKRDYYEVLRINRDADDAAIKKAYRKLAKKYHPDSNGGNAQAEQMFKEVTEAYTILSDPEKRKLYDRFGHAAFDGTGAAAGEEAEGSQGFDGFYGFGSVDDIFDDLFGGMFGSGSSGYGRSGYSSSGYGGSFARKGQDLTADVSVTFDEAAFGCEKVIRLQGEDGRVQSLQVHIPAGIETGKSIRLRGKGMPGHAGGPAGDLLLKVTVGSRPGFERKGMDVYSTISVPFAAAVLGGEVMVQTIHGAVMCRIKPGTQPGVKIRLRGKGISSEGNISRQGDHYAVVQIQVPTELGHEAAEKLREFQDALKREQRRKHGAA